MCTYIYGTPPPRVFHQLLCTRPSPPYFKEYTVCVYASTLNSRTCAVIQILHTTVYSRWSLEFSAHNPGTLVSSISPTEFNRFGMYCQMRELYVLSPHPFASENRCYRTAVCAIHCKFGQQTRSIRWCQIFPRASIQKNVLLSEPLRLPDLKTAPDFPKRLLQISGAVEPLSYPLKIPTTSRGGSIASTFPKGVVAENLVLSNRCAFRK